jgi:hypothetical protein
MNRLLGVVLGLALGVTEARADIVYLQSGRTLSVRSITEQGERLVLHLRGGGEIVCDRSLIVRVTPDEVPYPEPVTATTLTRDAADPAGLQEALAVPPHYQAIISRSSNAHGVDARLVSAVITVESGFQTRARSRKGAMGLMQLMPATARQYALRRPYDPAANIDAGTRHLRSLLDRFPLDLALAAYNAGEATVTRFQGIPPYPETRDYVTRILKLIGTSADKQ